MDPSHPKGIRNRQKPSGLVLLQQTVPYESFQRGHYAANPPFGFMKYPTVPSINRSKPTRVDSPLVLLALFGLALGSAATHNPLESAWACGLMLILLRWFWWQNSPGIMLFCLLMPFLEIHTTLLEANQSEMTLDQLFFGTGRKTFWMSSLALFTVALGVRFTWTLWSFKPIFRIETLLSAANKIEQRKLILAFFAAQFLSQLINQLIPFSSPLRQLEVYSNGISEALLFLLASKFMIDRKYGWAVTLITAYVLATSFYSFFSNWKEPIIILLVSYLIRISSFSLRHILRLSPILIPALFILFLWQSVKSEYRQFLNGGQFSQKIVVSQTEAFTKFQELAGQAVTEELIFNDETIDATYRRVGYLEYFSNAVAKVPTEIAHENGKLLTSNLEFALIPRILSPKKGLKDDKAKVEKYTDFYFGTYGGSSFSLGHYCEAYIDWGRFGMKLHLFIYGIIGGLLYMIILSRTLAFNPLLALGILWVCMKPWGTFQADMITLVGSVFWGSVCHLLIFFPLYKKLNNFITK